MSDFRWVVLIIVLLLQPALQYDPTQGPPTTGPFLDEIEFKVIDEADERDALYNNDTDMVGNFINAEDWGPLAGSLIDVSTTLRNGFGYFIINCAKYPLNITAFRRAFAYAIDKEYISDIVWDGLAEPLDTCLPMVNPMTYEPLRDYDYHQSNMSMANALLDDAGFIDIDSDGYREAPDGSNLTIDLATFQSSDIGQQICQHASGILEELGIQNVIILDDWGYGIYNRLQFHLDYDIIFEGKQFTDFSSELLAYDYWSEYADEPYYNYPNFRNNTYDELRDGLLNELDFERILNTTRELQKVILYECPIIPLYENRYLSAIRTDRFEGWINVPSRGIPNWWNYFGLNLQERRGGPYGGTLRVSIRRDISSFNIMILGENGQYGSDEYNILRLLYDSLLMQTPHQTQIPWLADSYSIQTYPDYNTMTITFSLNSSARWSDGSPLTAEDVSYSLNFFKNTHDIPLGRNLENLVNATVVSSNSVILHFNVVSYWNLDSIAFLPILPMTLLSEVGEEGWNRWEPDPRSGSLLTSGPYIISDYQEDERILLSANQFYFRRVNETIETSTTVETPLLSTPLLTIGAAAVIGITLLTLKWYEHRRARRH
ncbi:MAG: hypothetical protein KAR33_08175 [Candidatus Thorarchaeota archaeon]|nr:hypothetical protein [Candidatus Thorarchaeota archaeon]